MVFFLREILGVGQRGRCTAPASGERRDASDTHVLVAVFRILISPCCLTPKLQTQFDMNATVCEVPTSFCPKTHGGKSVARSRWKHFVVGGRVRFPGDIISTVATNLREPSLAHTVQSQLRCLNPRLRDFRSDRQRMIYDGSLYR